MPYRDVVRARVILMVADGVSLSEISRKVGLARRIVRPVDRIDRETPAAITQIHLVADNVSIHRGKFVCAWVAEHPRFRMRFTPVRCSWMNQVEQWLSILQRKRFRASNFDDLADLEAKALTVVDEWNETAHPFKWTSASFDKVMRRAEGWRSRVRHWTDDLKVAA
jgi:DDE superfamily endonuclease